jgi:hypothetical protein
MLKLSVIFIVLLLSLRVYAGGDVTQVMIKHLDWHGGHHYRLNVWIEHPPEYSYFGTCRDITLLGYYDFWRWLDYFNITYLGHKKALTYIAAMQQQHHPLSLGWIGHGFKALTLPCTFASTALSLHSDGTHWHVLSYHERY